VQNLDYDPRPETNEELLNILAAKIGSVRENERQIIAEELHDRIGQGLALALLKLEILENSVSGAQSTSAREVRKLIIGVVEETRSLICNLDSSALLELPFETALELLIEQTRSRYKFTCISEIAGWPLRLKPPVQQTLIQAVRELLVNTAKHARATEARVVLQREHDVLFTRVVDDGIGYDARKLTLPDPKRGGFGLWSLRQRLAAVGGCLIIDSALGKGTTTTIAIPVKTAEVNAA
jgi:signal transduction histidine kinase